MLLNLYEKLPPVVARPVIDHKLEYTTYGLEVVPGIKDPPRIVESIVHQRHLSIDVMDGYDPSVAAGLNHHSIYHLYEYEYKTRFLDRFTNREILLHEIPTRFLLCRYVICSIDEAMRQNKPFELMAIRLNGDIYIGANKTTDTFMNENNRMNAFVGCNFSKIVTTANAVSSFEKNHSVVKELRLEKHSSSKAMSIFVSSLVRAFDTNGDVVEVKTCRIDVLGKLQNLPSEKARNWWLRAFLSGADRIVYGLRRPDRKIHEIQEAKLTELTNGHFRFNGGELFSFIFNLFEKIDDFLLENGQMCMIRTVGFGHVSIVQADEEKLKRSPFW